MSEIVQPTCKEIVEEYIKINGMSHSQMAMLWRNAPAGYKYFDSRLPYHDFFRRRFDEYGGMTAALSKSI